MDQNKHYEEYLITNGTIKWTDKAPEGAESGKGIPLGCTGSLNVETEFKEVVKVCEGTPAKKRSKPIGMTAKFVGHVPVGVARKAFGLSNEGLKKGIYAYGEDSISGSGIFTWETLDLDEENKKFLAFPNGTFTGGLNISIENGADEIAQVEMTISLVKDENRKFYYDAFENDLDDDDVKKKWLTDFSLDLIRATETKESSGDDANERKVNTSETNTSKVENKNLKEQS